MSDGIRVLKFGGSSVGEPSVMRRAAMVATAALSRDGRPGSGPGVVVVSALGGVTRALVEIAALAIDGNEQAVAKAVGALEQRHTVFLADSGLSPVEHGAAQVALDRLFESLRLQLVNVPSDSSERPPFEDGVLAHGELLASQLFWAVLLSLGVRCQWMDARGFLRTDDHFRAAIPNLDSTRVLVQRLVRPLLQDGFSVVVPGFIGATEDGRSTTMGFEASDLTATVVGSSLGAREVQIWTDVSGVLSADPRSVAGATPLPHLAYDSARELALLGATVLHPDTMRPARSQGIPVRVMNCSRPGDPGTVIDADDPRGSDPRMHAVTSRRGQSVLRVATSVDMADAVLAFLHTLAKRQGIPNVLFTARAVDRDDHARGGGQRGAEVIAVTHSSVAARALEAAAGRFGTTDVADGMSVVSLVACTNRLPDWPDPTVETLMWDGLQRSRSVVVPDTEHDATLTAAHQWIEELSYTAQEAR